MRATRTVCLIIAMLFLLAVVLTACGPRRYRAEDAWARDTIFSVEKSYGGTAKLLEFYTIPDMAGE